MVKCELDIHGSIHSPNWEGWRLSQHLRSHAVLKPWTDGKSMTWKLLLKNGIQPQKHAYAITF